ncbi:GNAT family N-acetyltransferase [Lederbergia panacisoli]|uniref:GNAT family N-acetyltransferase n=1 Tax=Lederbergia panacisoli TaxID=1255251 RepID=UPI00214B99A2|nr:GNAT family N-acetyltransferase [Lederbergia panacisoli]MCR2823561.1 GNAT family N-acetyltransferase [Lederbergia panacisoli]
MKSIPLKMVRKDLLNIPKYSLVDGFQIRLFQRGDEYNWARIEASVDEFKNEKTALEHFTKEFGSHTAEMSKRCLFIENKDGDAIATTTAWYGNLNGDGQISGRIHWVSVVPEYQGKKLAKPLLSEAMNILAYHHTQAYLTTQTTSYQAINMYLNFGFEPFITAPSCYEGWNLMEKTLNRKIL